MSSFFFEWSGLFNQQQKKQLNVKNKVKKVSQKMKENSTKKKEERINK